LEDDDDPETSFAAATHWEAAGEAARAARAYLKAGKELKFSHLPRAHEAFLAAKRCALGLPAEEGGPLLSRALQGEGNILWKWGDVAGAFREMQAALAAAGDDAALRAVALSELAWLSENRGDCE